MALKPEVKVAEALSRFHGFIDLPMQNNLICV